MLQIFRNPYVGIIGSLASIISLFLAIYFYTAANSNRELTFYIHPAKASLVNANQDNQFQVLYRNSLVKSEVTAATLAFWNAGKKPIRENDILKPLQFLIQGGNQIFEAKILRKSREVVNITLDDSEKNKGIIKFDWNVLEKNDGASIQIIYEGSPNVKIEARSVIVGQPVISHLEYPGSIKSAKEQYTEYQKNNRRQGFVFLIMGFGFAVLVLVIIIYKSRKKKKSFQELLKKNDITITIQPVFLIGIGLYFLFFKSVPFPPFGF